MPAINFLPTENIRSQQAINVSKKLKYVGVTLAAICLVVGIASSAFIVYKNTVLSSLSKEEEGLKAQVLAAESTEQTLVLFRDRLNKMKLIFAKYPASVTLIEQGSLLNSFPEDVQLRKLTLDQGLATFTVEAPNSQKLQEAVDLTKTSGILNPAIDTLSFTGTLGFEVTITSK